MVKTRKAAISGAILASLAVSTPAQATCWSAHAVAAAQVRDLETMLMVSALRCRSSGTDFLGSYNQFVRSSRAALMQANTQLRAHFVAAGSGLNGYDRYVTALANRYGAGAEGLNCRDMAAITDAALQEGQSFAGLSALATRAEVQPELRGGTCPVTIAGRR